ncbi:DUF6308 family protein [Janibacter sp. Y6]|uniref:DUF6308 family protein n=1 Tax=Janibacter sp. Y6 TaxID=2913552 RepID=UPI0034A0DA76
MALLRGYFDKDALYSGAGFTGALFDTWDPTRTRTSSPDQFTPDDLQAVAFLSADISARAAMRLLDQRASEFNGLLAAVGADRELVDEGDAIGESWPATVLNRALRTLPGVGATRASKLIARKRPRLVPIFDSVINDHVLGGSGVLWEPMRQALRRDDAWLHHHLLALRDAAGLGPEVSALRVFDVIAWREGLTAGSGSSHGPTDPVERARP